MKSSWIRLIALWAGFVAFLATFFAIDWQLRDKNTGLQPMPGGIPDPIGEVVLLILLICFMVGAYFSLPKRWSLFGRISLGLVQTIAAFALMLVISLYYGLTWGIDTI